MKKMERISTSLLAIILLLTSVGFSYAVNDNVEESEAIAVTQDNPVEVRNIKDQEIEAILASMKDIDAKTKIQLYFYNPAYVETKIITDETKNFQDVDEEYKEAAILVSRLSKLNSTEVDLEISKLVLECINQNIGKMNIEWSEFFIKDYAAKYAPSYVDQLISQNVAARALEVEFNTSLENEAITPSITDETYNEYTTPIYEKTATAGAANIELVTLQVKANFRWYPSDNKLFYLAPTTTVYYNTPGYEAVEWYANSQEITSDGRGNCIKGIEFQNYDPLPFFMTFAKCGITIYGYYGLGLNYSYSGSFDVYY